MTSSHVAATPGLGAFALTRGGPLFRLERWLGIHDSLLRLVVVSMALTWGVGIGLALLDVAVRPNAPLRLLTLWGAHARMLVSIPLLLIAERELGDRVASLTARIVRQRFLDDGGRARWIRLVARLSAWRDATAPEVLILLGLSVFTVVGLLGDLPDFLLRWLAPSLHDEAALALRGSLAWWWFVLLAQPLFLFLTVRWLWRWLLWGIALVRLAGLEPQLQSGHPDCAGGIGFLETSLVPFAIFLLATSTALAGTWADEILATGLVASTFAPHYLRLATFGIVVGFAPFLPLTAVLVRARRAGRAAYAELARDYIRAFDATWLGADRPRGLLGTVDLQSLADLGTAYGVSEQMRVTVFSPRQISRVLLATILPLLPLVLLGMSATEIATFILKRLL